MKMEPIVSSETSAIITQTPGNYPKRNNLHLEHGESLRTRLINSFILITTHTCSQAHSQQRTLTQHDMLPQHPINIRELINECFKNNFSKEQRSYLKMILGSKHVGAILSILMSKFYVSAFVRDN